MNVLTLGTFDLFHAGHVNLLAQCRLLSSSEVTVGLNTDAFVERYKGRPPVVPYAAREAVLRACRHVDAVWPNDGPGRDLIDYRRPDIIVVGSDWRDRDYMAQLDVDAEWLSKRHISIVYVPYTEGISTTRLREAAWS